MTAYPPNAGIFEGPIPEMLMRSQERVEEAERAADEADRIRERYDEGIVAVEWSLAQLECPNLAVVPALMVSQMLGDVTRFANTGLKSGWLEKALREVR